MTQSESNGTAGEEPDVTATGAPGAGSGDAAGTPPRGDSGAGDGRKHHTYYEGGPGASSEPGGEDEYDHAPGGSAETEGIALAEEDTMAATLLADLQRLQAEYVNYKKLSLIHI